MPKFDLSCSIVCSENFDRLGCPSFSVTATDRTSKTLTIRTTEIKYAGYLFCCSSVLFALKYLFRGN